MNRIQTREIIPALQSYEAQGYAYIQRIIIENTMNRKRKEGIWISAASGRQTSFCGALVFTIRKIGPDRNVRHLFDGMLAEIFLHQFSIKQNWDKILQTGLFYSFARREYGRAGADFRKFL